MNKTKDTGCSSNPCLNGGACYNHASSYTCGCPAEWTGTNCQTCEAFSLKT